jgi:hypothetical protein
MKRRGGRWGWLRVGLGGRDSSVDWCVGGKMGNNLLLNDATLRKHSIECNDLFSSVRS